MKKYLCPKCDNGIVHGDEDGRPYQDDCYHCEAKGWIDEESANEDRFATLIATFATNIVARMRKVTNEEAPEPWGFHAAENGMSEYEYTTERTYQEIARLEKALDQLDSLQRIILCDMANIPTLQEYNHVNPIVRN